MLFFRLTTKACLSPKQLRCTRLWPSCSFLCFHSDYPLRCVRQRLYVSTDVPSTIHQFTCSVYFFCFGITCTVTFQLIYWGTYTEIHPKINLPVYLHSSLSSNHKDLPVTTTTCVPADRCTRSGPYLFILKLSHRLTVKIYLSIFLLLCISTYVPVHQYTCSVDFFLFGITCSVTFQLICWRMHTQIYPKINLPVYLHASPFV